MTKPKLTLSIQPPPQQAKLNHKQLITVLHVLVIKHPLPCALMILRLQLVAANSRSYGG